jgi:hypothetical protein
MPGISGTRITPGPAPFSYTSWVTEPAVKERRLHPVRSEVGAVPVVTANS